MFNASGKEGKQFRFQFLSKGAFRYGRFGGKTELAGVHGGKISIKIKPYVFPGIAVVRIIRKFAAVVQQKNLMLFHGKALAFHVERSPAVQHEMNGVLGLRAHKILRLHISEVIVARGGQVKLFLLPAEKNFRVFVSAEKSVLFHEKIVAFFLLAVNEKIIKKDSTWRKNSISARTGQWYNERKNGRNKGAQPVG